MEKSVVFTVKQISEMLGVGRDLAYKAVNDGTIPSVRIGNRIVVPKPAFDKFLAGRNEE